jgi:predicted small lipoprotein YifL
VSRFAPAAVVALAVAVVTGCGDKGNDRIPAAATLTIETATTLSPTSSAPGTGAQDSAPAIGSVSGGGSTDGDGTLHGVGEAVPTANGNTVKLRAVDPAGAGPNRYAVDVEICANNVARVAPSQFSLELANGSAVTSVADGRTPALASSDVAGGQCAGGWVTFQLPPDQPGVALVFRGSSVIRWSLA